MRVPLGDGYAVKLLASGYHYEPEIEPLVRAAMRRGCCFIDGGANLGYWSVFASNYSNAPDPVVAIEPVPQVFELLHDNAELNNGRFQCRQAALWSEHGTQVTVVAHPQWHAGSSAVRREPILVKLDVEGAEPDALAGAAETLAGRDMILLYEDHGSDDAHRSTRYVLDELGFRVFACTEHGVEEVTTLRDVAAHKTDTVHGFNFAAYHPQSTIGPEVIVDQSLRQ